MPFSLDANTTKYNNLQVNTIWQAFAWFWKVHSGLFSCTRLSMHHPVKCSYLTHFDWIFTEIIENITLIWLSFKPHDFFTFSKMLVHCTYTLICFQCTVVMFETQRCEFCSTLHIAPDAFIIVQCKKNPASADLKYDWCCQWSVIIHFIKHVLLHGNIGQTFQIYKLAFAAELQHCNIITFTIDIEVMTK